MNVREMLFNNRKEYFLGKEKVVAEKFHQPSYYQQHSFRLVKRYHILWLNNRQCLHNHTIICVWPVTSTDTDCRHAYQQWWFLSHQKTSKAIVINVKCKSLRVRFYISILIFSNLYVEMVTVRFHSLPHCETNNRSQLLLSAYLSVPHSFEAFNLNSHAISLSQL